MFKLRMLLIVCVIYLIDSLLPNPLNFANTSGVNNTCTVIYFIYLKTVCRQKQTACIDFLYERQIASSLLVNFLLMMIDYSW